MIPLVTKKDNDNKKKKKKGVTPVMPNPHPSQTRVTENSRSFGSIQQLIKDDNSDSDEGRKKRTKTLAKESSDDEHDDLEKGKTKRKKTIRRNKSSSFETP